jgi:hypothetical protein
MKKVLVFDHQIEAELMEEILKEEGIAYHIQSYHQAGLNGIFQLEYGWGHLEVEADHKDQVMALYEELKKGIADGGDSDE